MTCFTIHVCSVQMLVPAVTGDINSQRWPQVVSQDVTRHTGGLKGKVFVLTGEVKGRTLLPFSPQAEVATEVECDK